MPTFLSLTRPPRRLRVAIFNASGASRPAHPAATSCMVALTRTPWFRSRAVFSLLWPSLAPQPRARGCRPAVLTSMPPVQVEMLRAEEICAGRLLGIPGYPIADGGGVSSFDVLVVPGGSAAKDARLLGEEGRAAIRTFVRRGGGYCGICAGAFLALRSWKYRSCLSLGLVDAGLLKAHGGAGRTGLSRGQAPCRASVEGTSYVPDALGTSCTIEGSTSDCGGSSNSSSSSRNHDDSHTEADAPLVNDLQPASQSFKKVRRCSRLRRDRDARLVDVRFSKLGRRYLWAEGNDISLGDEDRRESKDRAVRMRYHNGPLLSVPLASSARVLARMWPVADPSPLAAITEVLPAAPSGNVAMLLDFFGSGRAVLISPHPESTQEGGDLRPEPGRPCLRRVLQRAVMLASAGTRDRVWIQDGCHVPA